MDVASLVLGILGAVAWLLPLFGYPINIVGLILGILAKKKRMSGMATAGIILTIIGLVLTIINSVAGAIMYVTRLLF